LDHFGRGASEECSHAERGNNKATYRLLLLTSKVEDSKEGYYLDSQKFFCNHLFLLAFLADQNIFWSRPGIYSNLLTLFHTTRNEEPGTLNSQIK
ncbi:hypothetical protein, partial [Desulfonatronospira sp.]|uniref:hypothetical protein n=1 Tax=Desulfonatronospira sp. TaxID=1962951 RepID=UPI0025C6D52B